MDLVRFLRAEWDRSASWVLITAGALLVMTGGARARDAADLFDEFSFIMTGGIAGLLAGAVGGVLLLTAGLHDEWRRLRRIQMAMAQPAFVDVSVKRVERRGVRDLVRAAWVRVLGSVVVTAAAVSFIIAARGLAGSPSSAEQIAYLISGGLGALYAVCLGAAFLVWADMRDIESQLSRMKPLAATEWSGPRKDSASSSTPAVMCAAGILVAGGAVLVGVGWATAAGTNETRQALDGLLVAVIGIVVGASVTGGVLIGYRRQLTRRVWTLLSRIGRVADIASLPPAGADEPEVLWTAEGLSRFHQRSCLGLSSASGRVRPVDGGDAALVACGVCCGEEQR